MEAPRVQHVTKASSDELLRKFAGTDSDSDSDSGNEISSSRKSPAKRRKISRNKNRSNYREDEEQSLSKEDGNGSLSLRKSLLAHQRGRKSGSLLRHLGISRSHHVRGCRNKSVLGALEKTWSKAVRGASKVFMEKHYNRHRLLINDMV